MDGLISRMKLSELLVETYAPEKLKTQMLDFLERNPDVLVGGLVTESGFDKNPTWTLELVPAIFTYKESEM